MKRIGTVLVFRQDVTEEQATAILSQIAHMLDLPATTTEYLPTGKRTVKEHERPFKIEDMIEAYDDEHCGGPIWYIP